MWNISKRKLELFGHIARMGKERKVKDVMLGRMEGKSRKCRPCREWLDDIKDWTNMNIQQATH